MILHMENLTKRFGGVQALEDFSLSVDRQELTAIIGPNGAGKTTLFDILCGLTKADKGRAYLQGRLINDLPPHRIAELGIARTFQLIRLFPELTVIENLLLAHQRGAWATLWQSLLRASDQAETRLISRSLQWLSWTGLDELAYQPAKTLSYGQRKLVELIRAVLTQADVFLLDEPVSGIYPEMKDTVAALLQKITSEQGKTILFIEHDIDFVLNVAERVVVMDRGRRIFDGTSQQLLESSVIEEVFHYKVPV